jgi:hypothetical protein
MDRSLVQSELAGVTAQAKAAEGRAEDLQQREAELRAELRRRDAPRAPLPQASGEIATGGLAPTMTPSSQSEGTVRKPRKRGLRRFDEPPRGREVGTLFF